MTKNNKRLIIFFILLSIFPLLILLGLKLPCLFKLAFNLSCPACGLTRSILAILNFKILESIYYNIIGIPVFIILVISYLLIIVDILKNNNYLSRFWIKIINYYKLIILLLTISFIINNFHKI